MKDTHVLKGFCFSFILTGLLTVMFSILVFGWPPIIYVIGIIVSILVPSVLLPTAIEEGKSNLIVALTVLGVFVPVIILILSLIK